MKIINTIFVYTLIFLLLNCLVESRIEKKVKANNLKKVKTRKVSTSLTSKNNIDTTPTPTMTIPEPTPITDPKGTVFYQFALGASNILVSDPEAASECQLQDWMVDQPSIQAGTAQWFEELADFIFLSVRDSTKQFSIKNIRVYTKIVFIIFIF